MIAGYFDQDAFREIKVLGAQQDVSVDVLIHEANQKLGFAADCRDYDLAAGALKLLGVSRVRLMTNNPDKVAALESAGIAVTERVSAEVESQESFERYLRTKQEKMGHIFDHPVNG